MGSELFSQIALAADTAVALAITVWILSLGVKRFDQMQTAQTAFVDKMFGKYEQMNNRLMDIVERKCAGDSSPLPIAGGKT